MVDCRPPAGAPGAPPHELAHSAPNGGSVDHNNHHNQQAGPSGDMGAHGVASPASVRASTPATTNTLTTYTGNGGMGPGMPGAPYGAVPYVCGVKPLVWMPPQHGPPPAPVNPHVFKSVQANGADLPMNDIPTLRYYFNLGVECMWAAYGPPQHPPPRHYSPRDLTQDMQQISLHDRPAPAHGAEHKHKPPPADKPPINNQNKGNGQRPLLGPRFKRGNNQDGSQNSNHNPNKGGHNNNMGNKGPNNRRNSHPDGRSSQPHVNYSSAPEGECVMEQPMLTLPYIPYPPPLYPIPYYPVESDPAMMGMMGGMGYVGYEEGVEFGAPMQPYYAPPHYPPPHPAHLPHHHQHNEHK